MSSAITKGIRVSVEPRYLPEHSQPRLGKWVFGYTVRIANEGEESAQLVRRQWEITDAEGRVQYVEGDGVVGRQPVLPPGAVHEYSSFCPLPTPFGAMRGRYRMVRPDGTAFEAEIAPFTLAMPGTLN